MNETESLNFAEYVYEKKNEGKVKFKRQLAITLYILFILAFFGFCYFTRIIPLFAIAPLLLYIIVLLTWRLVKYDVFWTFSLGKLEIGRVKQSRFGSRRKSITTIQIKDAIYISPYVGKEQLKEVKKVYDFSESRYSDKRIVIIYTENQKRCCALIEGTLKLGKLLSRFSDKCENVKGEIFHG